MATKKPKIAIGIDLGTTNSCVAAWKNGKLEVIPNTKTGDCLTPSWVVYKPQEAAVGNTAKYSSSIKRDVKTTLFDIKRIIGRKYCDPITQKVIKNWPFNVVNHSGIPRIELEFASEKKYVFPEEVSALILTEMKTIAQTYLDEENITDAVITVPAYFNDHQRQATKDAAKIAGLNVLRLINEPTAGAISYIFDKPEKNGRNILIYDLGGGTFDVSIITLKGSSIEVKATLGDTNLGGANFDQKCTDYFIGLVEKQHNLNIDIDDKSLLRRRLQNMIEQRKHDLASTSSCTITIDYFYKDISLDEELSRARFNSMNNDLFEKTIEIVKQCIAEAKLKKEEIDDIVLVGGSTRILAIQEKLEDYFGKKLKQDINADQAVARGAGILAASLSGALKMPLTVCDVLPMSLGIETLDSSMNVVVKRNTQIPTVAKRSYTTGQKDQQGVRITIFMGDNKIARNNTELGTFSLVNLPETPSIEVIFQLDINGILTVDAEETSSGIRKTINLTLNKGRLTEQNVQELKRRSDLVVMQNIKGERINLERSMLESYLFKLKGDIKRGENKFNRQKKDAIIKMVEVTLIWMRTKEAYDVSNISKKFAEVKLIEKP